MYYLLQATMSIYHVIETLDHLLLFIDTRIVHLLLVMVYLRIWLYCEY